MTFSEYAGTAIVPTLSRLVLAAAFLSAGYNKVFKDMEFPAEQATVLKNMGVSVTPVSTSAAATPRYEGLDLVLVPASYQDTSSPPTTGSPSHPTVTTTLAPGMYRAKAMYAVALMIHNQHWFSTPRYEVWLTWVAAYTELIGGAMMLLGLFARLWGLGLACVMGVAFFMTSMQPPMEVHKHLTDFFSWGQLDNGRNFSTVFIQLAFFTLAFGVMLTGAGPLSLDRLLFGGDRRPPNPAPPGPVAERPLRYDRAG